MSPSDPVGQVRDINGLGGPTTLLIVEGGLLVQYNCPPNDSSISTLTYICLHIVENVF